MQVGSTAENHRKGAKRAESARTEENMAETVRYFKS